MRLVKILNFKDDADSFPSKYFAVFKLKVLKSFKFFHERKNIFTLLDVLKNYSLDSQRDTNIVFEDIKTVKLCRESCN